MRAEFDRLIDVYWGVDVFATLCPRIYNMPARWITDDAFFESGEPFTEIEGYVTADAISFTAPVITDVTGNETTLNWGDADLVAIVAGGPITHQVYRAELRSWPTGTDYSRAFLGPVRSSLPAPCSDSYAEEYEYGLGGPGSNILTRTGPKTWTDGTYTLTAETAPGITCACVSRWTFTDGTDAWETDYNGIAAPGLFGAIPPAAPPFVWIYPV